MSEIVVRGGTTLKRTRSAGSLTANLVATKSLTQHVAGESVLVDWTVSANQPIVYPMTRHSRYTGLIYSYSEEVWKYDGEEILATDARFEITTYTVGSNQVPALKIKANLALSFTSSKQITFEAKVEIQGIKEGMSAGIDVTRMIASPSTYQGQIAMTNGGVISTDNKSIALTSLLTQGGNPVTDFTVEWWKIVAIDTDGVDDGMTDLGKSGKSINISDSEIELMETIVCKFKVGGTVVDVQYQEIRDETDPYDLEYTYDPALGGYADEVSGVKTTVKVVTRAGRVEIPSISKFAFRLMSGAATIASDISKTKNYFQTLPSHFDTANSDELFLAIEASES